MRIELPERGRVVRTASRLFVLGVTIALGYLGYVFYFSGARVERAVSSARALANPSPESYEPVASEDELAAADRVLHQARRDAGGFRPDPRLSAARRGDPDALTSSFVQDYRERTAPAVELYATLARSDDPALTNTTGCSSDSDFAGVARADNVRDPLRVLIWTGIDEGDDAGALAHCVDAIAIARDLSCGWSDIEWRLAQVLTASVTRPCLQAIAGASPADLHRANEALTGLMDAFCEVELITRRSLLCEESLILAPSFGDDDRDALPDAVGDLVRRNGHLGPLERFIYTIVTAAGAREYAGLRDGMEAAFQMSGAERDAALDAWARHTQDELDFDLLYRKSEWFQKHGEAHRAVLVQAIQAALARGSAAWSSPGEGPYGSRWVPGEGGLLLQVPSASPWVEVDQGRTDPPAPYWLGPRATAPQP